MSFIRNFQNRGILNKLINMNIQRRIIHSSTVILFVTLLFLLLGAIAIATSTTTTCCKNNNNNLLHSISVGLRSAGVVSRNNPILTSYTTTCNRRRRRRISHCGNNYDIEGKDSWLNVNSHSHSHSHSNTHDNGLVSEVEDTTKQYINHHLSQNKQSISFCSLSSSPSTKTRTNASKRQRTGGAKANTSSRTKTKPTRQGSLNFWENMICGAVSRSVAQIATHPANTMKTLLQSNRDTTNRLTLKQMAKVQNLKMLTRGAGAQFILSIPHGAVNFAVLEYVRKNMNNMVVKSEWATKKKESNGAFGPALDFLSSTVATICVSVISTPQMMIVDNIMAGTYANLPKAVQGLSAEKGLMGFYAGWWPGLAGKIPSYALTWTLFQQLKELQLKVCQRPPKDFENSIMGCMASATSVCILIPMDTIKTRLVTQMNYPDLVPYKGIVDAAVRITKEEGIGTFYRGLPPRLISVVPMVGIQFGTYEFMKRVMKSRRQQQNGLNGDVDSDTRRIETVSMEVAADDDQPHPAPELGRR